MTENREFKSAVFSMLMEDKVNALQVYNVLNGSTYDDPEQVEIVSLESGISLSIRNDAAFIVDASITISEHQSSYNPNMPLRSLFYFVEIIKGMLGKRDIFSSRIIKIPTPYFVVFYNGTEDRPERETMKLSAAFEKSSDAPELELICTVYNINPGKDVKLLQKCKVLDEYTGFVEAVRNFNAEGVEKPIEKAIDHCISHHILEGFLKERRMEVLNAMAIDMTFERREALIREEERENTERERKRADKAEKELQSAKERINQLEEMLHKIPLSD